MAEESGSFPAGYEPWPRRSPFGDAAGPLMFRRDGAGLTFATRVEERHGNARGVAHGGMLSTFADLALGYAAAFSTEPPTPMRSASLSIDYLRAVRVGQILSATPELLRLGSRLAHVRALLLADEEVAARANATLVVLEV